MPPPPVSERRPAHSLGQRSHHHRSDDRQHLLEDAGRDPGCLGGARRDAAAYVLRAEDVAEDAVAVFDDLLLVAVEIARVVAACQRSEQSGQPVRRCRFAPESGLHRRHQLIHRRTGLRLAETELPREHRKVSAVIALA